MKELELKKDEIDYRGKSRPTALFVKFSSLKIPLNGWEVTYLIGIMQQK